MNEPIVAVFRPREVSATQLTNGNWLVEDNGDRCVYRPEEFARLFEIRATNEDPVEE